MNIKNWQLTGEIIKKIDETLFGHKMKYHIGNPGPGLKILILGMVARSTNTIILYPLTNRSADTLTPLIPCHVSPGSTIFSHGWSAYCNLNELGYKHFTVIHK